MEDADRNPNLLGVFGGNGGGVSSDPVLPVSCLRDDELSPVVMYLALIYRSMAESASSASIGTGGLLPSGLYILLEVTLPTFLIF